MYLLYTPASTLYSIAVPPITLSVFSSLPALTGNCSVNKISSVIPPPEPAVGPLKFLVSHHTTLPSVEVVTNSVPVLLNNQVISLTG